MINKEIPLVPGRKVSLPTVYGDTPSFLGCDVLSPKKMKRGFDVIFSGAPWEGAITWGSFSGCELAPRSIRHAAARYGGFLPEYEIDLFEYLRIGDLGDISINPNEPEESMRNIFEAVNRIYENQSIPFILGGDHSITPEVVRALNENVEGEIGIIHFDSHFDNNRSFGDDLFPRCGPLYRVAQIEKVRKKSIVHIGIRGPRNSVSQMEYAKSIGAKIFTMREIRRQGIEKVMDAALNMVREKTKHIYVTICSDIIDAGFNPGGPADFNGLFPYELFHALYRLGELGIEGLDYVEIYPMQDPHAFSSHLAAWAIICALGGLASKKKHAGSLKR